MRAFKFLSFYFPQWISAFDWVQTLSSKASNTWTVHLQGSWWTGVTHVLRRVHQYMEFGTARAIFDPFTSSMPILRCYQAEMYSSQAIDLTTEIADIIHGRSFYSDHDWTSSLPFYNLLALGKITFATLEESIDRIMHCSLEIHSQLTTLFSGRLPHNYGNKSPEII